SANSDGFIKDDLFLRRDSKVPDTTPTPRPTASPLGSPTPQSAQASPTPSVAPVATLAPTPTPSPAATVSKEDLIAVHFADANRGWTLNRLGQLFVTTDSGNSWTTELSVASTSAPLRSAQFDADGNIVLFVSESGNLSAFDKSQQRYIPVPAVSDSHLSAGCL